MALTIGNSPLARSPGGKFNFEIERIPRHLLYLEDFQKRIRGQLAGETIVDSRRGKLLHETGKLPQRVSVFWPSAEWQRVSPSAGL